MPDRFAAVFVVAARLVVFRFAVLRAGIFDFVFVVRGAIMISSGPLQGFEPYTDWRGGKESRALLTGQPKICRKAKPSTVTSTTMPATVRSEEKMALIDSAESLAAWPRSRETVRAVRIAAR